jgi:hypothetical protein
VVLFVIFNFKFLPLADNLKDLLRFLRRDDPQTRDVFKQVCKWNIVSKDLIPIIELCQDDSSLVLNAGRFCLFLHPVFGKKKHRISLLLLLLFFFPVLQ